MSALLELGLGFSAELTVRENVELYAAVLGYPRREAKRRVEEAIQFAGLERFRDAKLKNLSTGMRARLGFATALQAESDILLLDEILAVGDADFQLKCLDVFEEFKQQRRTIVLVTHDLGQVQRFCDRAVLLERGRIKADGDPDTVIPLYLQSVGQLQVDAVRRSTRASARATASMRCQRAWVEDERGRPIGRARSGDRIVIAARLRDHRGQRRAGARLRAEERRRARWSTRATPTGTACATGIAGVPASASSCARPSSRRCATAATRSRSASPTAS